ncbi:MAG: discoidin domain-containing protein [Armatimonadota bacterium]
MRFAARVFCLMAIASCLCACAQADNSSQPVNIALGCPVTFDPAPNYSLCKDPDDAKQLTDGVYHPDFLWGQRGSVGWQGVSPVLMTIDLGKVQPIGAISYSTAANFGVGVFWPSAVIVAVSDDNITWHFAGDLMVRTKTDAPSLRNGYVAHRFVSDDPKTRGRYVRLAVANKSYVMVDEIEVCKGQDEYLNVQPSGEVIADIKTFAQQMPCRSAIKRRVAADIRAVKAELDASNIAASKKSRYAAALKNIADNIDTLPEPAPADKLIMPYCSEHAQVFAVYGAILSSRGLPPLFAWKKPRYEYVGPCDCPKSPPKDTGLSIDMMRQERRSESFLITNASEKPVSVNLSVKGLHGSPNPAWIKISSVPWTDTAEYIPVAAALPDDHYTKGGYPVSIPAGMTRKIWITVDSSKLASSRYKGILVIDGARRIKLPFDLNVSRVAMIQPGLSVCMWDYTDGDKDRGLTQKNMSQAIKLMREGFVDSPWGQPVVLPWPKVEDFDSNNKLKAALSFDNLDKWVNRWHGASNYFVFAYVGDSFAGAKAGEAAFDARVSEWSRLIAGHVKSLGISPKRFGLHLIDEPSSDAQAQLFVQWAKAIKSGAPDLCVFSDPWYPNPETGVQHDAFLLMDVVCPQLCEKNSETTSYMKYYITRRSSEQALWFYRAWGPTRIYDPYRYYRMLAWYAFKYGAQGIGSWSFGDIGTYNPASGGNSWNEFGVDGQSFTPVFIASDDVTDGIHWQAMQEGVEDYACLSMLKDAATKTKNMALKAQAERVLAEARALPTDTNSGDFDWLDRVDTACADKIRLQALRLLEKML